MAADGFNENGEIVVPDCVRGALRSLVGQIDALDEAIGAIDRELAASVKADETAKRLMTIPGVGPVTASAIRATIQDASAFASGREFAAFLGLTPRQNSTGGKTRLGRITKMGDRYLRKLLVVGACATLRHRRGHSDALRLWASGMLERKTVKYKFNLTAVALANKVARIVFVLMTRGGVVKLEGLCCYGQRGGALGAHALRTFFLHVERRGLFLVTQSVEGRRLASMILRSQEGCCLGVVVMPRPPMRFSRAWRRSRAVRSRRCSLTPGARTRRSLFSSQPVLCRDSRANWTRPCFHVCGTGAR